jgi:hypothetical protein
MGSEESGQVLRALTWCTASRLTAPRMISLSGMTRCIFPSTWPLPVDSTVRSGSGWPARNTQYGPDKPGNFPCLTVYEIDHDMDETFAAIDAARKAGNLTPPPGPVAQTCALVWVPLGERAARSQDK